MSDTQEHPDWFRAHDGRWYPKDELPTGGHAAAPPPPPDRRWLLAGVAVVVAAVAVVAFVVTRGGDEAPDEAAPTTAPTVESDEPATVLDEVFPDRPDGVAGSPTPDAAGAADAAAALEVVETAWVRSAFDDLDFVVVIRNTADVAFANVNVNAVFVNESGDELAREPFSYPIAPAGGDLIVSGLRPIDPDDVAEILVEITARGSVADSPPNLDMVDVSWDQDPAGTVILAGSVVAAAPAEFVSVVGVLRDGDGDFLGTAFAFVSAVTPDQPSSFEALGFPAGDVAVVDVYVNG